MKGIQTNTQETEALELDAGEMIHQITIFGQVDSEDESGPMVVHQPVVTLYASIEVNRATDFVRDGEVTTHTWLRIGIWFQPQILPNMRVYALNGWYVIQGIENVLNMDVVEYLECIAIRGFGDQLANLALG
jgi:hypothetical protein